VGKSAKATSAGIVEDLLMISVNFQHFGWLVLQEKKEKKKKRTFLLCFALLFLLARRTGTGHKHKHTALGG